MICSNDSFELFRFYMFVLTLTDTKHFDSSVMTLETLLKKNALRQQSISNNQKRFFATT